MADSDSIDQLVRDSLIPMTGLLSLLMPGSATVGFAIKGLDGRYRLANRTIERLLCGDGERLAGKSEEDLLPLATCRLLAESDRRILAGETAASIEIDLAVHGQNSQCLWLKLPVLGVDRKLQAIASLIDEASPQPGFVAMQQTLARLQQSNRELQQTVAELEQVASTDKLTGAWNRHRLEEGVRSEMDRLNRYQHPLSLLILDIDCFKPINDQHGHATGDAVLKRLTTLLQAKLRSADSLARWGGEEFVILCPNTERSTAAMLAERLRRDVAMAKFPEAGAVTVSIGVAECEPGESWEQWFERADEALYRAKTGGRNQVQAAPETPQRAGPEQYVVANFVQLVWHPAYECGNELVDRGHRQLFADANELLSAILSEHAVEQVNAIVDRLVADILLHFGDEEAVIVAAGFPAAAEHIVLHRALVDQALQLTKAYRTGTKGVGDVFQFLAYDVVTKHMLGADRLFFDTLQPQATATERPGKRLSSRSKPPQRQSTPAMPGPLA